MAKSHKKNSSGFLSAKLCGQDTEIFGRQVDQAFDVLFLSQGRPFFDQFADG
jgi:hypothetical protein